jgi:hypothetical protein
VKRLGWLALSLLACTREGDRVLARFDTTPPIEVRERFNTAPVPCSETGWRVLLCPFRAKPAGRCVYGRLGRLRGLPAPGPCYDEAEGGERFFVVETTGTPPAAAHAQSFVDDAGARLLVQYDTLERLVVVLDGGVVIQTTRARSADPTAALARPLADELAALSWSDLGDAPGLVAPILRASGGAPAVASWLGRSFNRVTDDVWNSEFMGLPPEHQRALASQLTDATLGPPDAGADWRADADIANGGMIWLLEHPVHRPPGFHARALEQAARDISFPTTLLDYLASRREPVAGDAACKALEESLTAESFAPDEEASFDGARPEAPTPDIDALYVLAAMGRACPAATQALELLACDEELSCGDVLCTPAQGRALALAQVTSFEPSDAGAADDAVAVGRLAPALTAAALVGRPSAEVAAQLARRGYRLVDQGCERQPAELLSEACRAPTDNHTVLGVEYTLKIDDVHRTVTCRPQR